MEHYEVWLDRNYIYVRNEQGDVASKPIARYERLHKASDEQRNAFELSSCHFKKLFSCFNTDY